MESLLPIRFHMSPSLGASDGCSDYNPALYYVTLKPRSKINFLLYLSQSYIALTNITETTVIKTWEHPLSSRDHVL